MRTGPRHAAPKKPSVHQAPHARRQGDSHGGDADRRHHGDGLHVVLALADNGSTTSPSSKSLTADEYKDCVSALAESTASATPSASPSRSASDSAKDDATPSATATDSATKDSGKHPSVGFRFRRHGHAHAVRHGEQVGGHERFVEQHRHRDALCVREQRQPAGHHRRRHHRPSHRRFVELGLHGERHADADRVRVRLDWFRRRLTPARPTPSRTPTKKVTDTVDDTVKDTTDTATKAADEATKAAEDTATATATPSASASADTSDCPVATDDTSGVDNKILVPDDPWYLNASSLLLEGADYQGVVEVKTASGKVKKVLKYVISGGTDIGDLHQTVDDKQSGKTYHVQAAKGSTSTIRDGDTVMYTESISGNLFGLIPITFDPDNPPPLNIPLIYFTNVEGGPGGPVRRHADRPGAAQLHRLSVPTSPFGSRARTEGAPLHRGRPRCCAAAGGAEPRKSSWTCHGHSIGCSM
ncbi:hypothetical protein ACRAWF_11945 [Streptomyces sp. L7]